MLIFRPLPMTALAALALVLSACTSPQGTTPDQKRQAILDESQQTLRMLYADKDVTEQQVRDAVGYATFSNISTQVLLVGGGNGYGVAVNNQTGDRTFMTANQIEGGPGIGVASYRSVFIFETQKAFDSFINGKWLMDGETDAVAKTDTAGGSAETTASFDPDVDIYHMGEDGLQVKVNISGISFQPDDQLNP